MNASAIDEGTRKELDSVISRLPPIAYWVACQTQDQRNHFQLYKKGYGLLREELEAAFKGQKSGVLFLPDEEREFWGAMVDRYLAWYFMAQHGWDYIEAFFLEKIGDQVGSFCGHSGIPANTPGTALIRVLEDECLGFLAPSFSKWYRFSPEDYRKRDRIESLIYKGEATPRQGKKYELSVKEQFRKGQRFYAFFFNCVNACEENARKDKRMKRKLNELYRADDEVQRILKSQRHPRKGMQGYEWNLGNLGPIS